MALVGRVGVLTRLGAIWCVDLWRNIRSRWDCFLCFIRYVVGNSSKISLWHDLWNGETTLKERYYNLFLIARDRDAMVADFKSLEIVFFFNWNPLFIQVVCDCEIESMAQLSHDIYATKIHHGEEDKLG